MAKLLVVKKNGSVHIRAKSDESGAEPEKVHPNKLQTWINFGEASHNAAGKTMEDVIQSVIDETCGVIFKEDKPKIEVTGEEYLDLATQCAKKGISKAKLDSIVVLKKIKEKTPEEMVEEFIQTRT